MNEIPPNEVGRRLREIRAWRGQSMEVAAGLAGISFGYLGKLERGDQPLTNRATVEALARALKVAPSEFIGSPWESASGPEPQSHAALVAIEDVLDSYALGKGADVPARDWPEVAADLDRLQDLIYGAADYAAQGELAPRLMAELHALYVERPDLRRDVLRTASEQKTGRSNVPVKLPQRSSREWLWS